MRSYRLASLAFIAAFMSDLNFNSRGGPVGVEDAAAVEEHRARILCREVSRVSLNEIDMSVVAKRGMLGEEWIRKIDALKRVKLNFFER